MKRKRKDLFKVLWLLPLVWLEMGFLAQAQSLSREIRTLDEVIEIALANNPTLKAASLEVEQQRALRGSSWNLPKTEVSWVHGQYNSVRNDDNQFNISQRLEFPTVYSHQKQLAKARIEGSEQQRIATQNELIREVKSTWYALWLAQSKHLLLLTQDSIYRRYRSAAALRYQTGESNMLEKATAESQVAQIELSIAQNEADISILQTELMTLLHVDEPVQMKPGPMVKRKGILETDSLDISQNPTLEWFRQMMHIADKEKSIEKAQLMPDITLGYFNQSLNGTGLDTEGTPTRYTSSDRFDGFQVGLAIPLFGSKAHISQIQAAEYRRQTTEAQLEATTIQLQGKLKALVEQYSKHQSSLKYYNENALPQSDLILAQAQKGFDSGSINYNEYTLGLTMALNIKFNYLETLNMYNQTLIQIEYITGIQ
ncbi:TolC family protein [Reichenbachiella sp. 5M10]|uniref:TolC family protein n=1 Tax=Reichenbachiella sp. 5M10 TaxID=1889772 RepID=UPI001C879FCD